MATKLIRRNGQLVMEEIAPESQPTSPGGAAALGASPDQAKMYGGSAQKQAAISQAIEPSQSLQSAQRYAGPRSQLTAGEEAATSKAARLSQLGGLGARVEAKVREQFEQPLEAAQAQLSPEMIQGFDEEQQGLLQQIVGAATPEEREAALVGLANARGTDTTQVQAMLQDMGVSLGQQGQTAVGLTDVKLDQGILDEFGGADQIAADMGISVEELAQMNVNDFDAKLQELESNQFSQVEALKAEMGSASPIRRQEIMEELKSLGATGITGVEKSVETLQQQIDEADIVFFGGVEYELGDLLENDAISDAIMSSVRDPATLEELKKTEPALASWVEANKKSLEDIVGDIEESQTALQQTTANLRELTEGVSEELQGAFGIDSKFMTASQLEQQKAKLEQLGTWQAMKTSPEIARVFNEKPGIIGTLVKKDPDTGEDVPLSQDEVMSAYEAGKQFTEGSYADELTKMYGGDNPTFITDPELKGKVETAVATLEALPSTAAGYEDVTLDLIKSGELTPELAAEVNTADLDNFRQRKEGLAFVEKNKGNNDKLLQWLTGDVGAEGLNKQLAEAKKWASIDPEAANIVKALQALDTDGDGKISANDKVADKMAEFLGAGKSAEEMIGLDPSQMFSSIRNGILKSSKADPVSEASTRFIRDALAGDNNVSVSEWRNMDADTRKKLEKLQPDRVRTLIDLEKRAIKREKVDKEYNTGLDAMKLVLTGNDYITEFAPKVDKDGKMSPGKIDYTAINKNPQAAFDNLNGNINKVYEAVNKPGIDPATKSRLLDVYKSLRDVLSYSQNMVKKKKDLDAKYKDAQKRLNSTYGVARDRVKDEINALNKEKKYYGW